jgi:energy-coupling factor transporter ATP-binding protein EcfA2
MTRGRRLTLAAPPPDPFGEHRRAAWRFRRQLLGARFDFETDSRPLQRVVEAAYARLPSHTLAAPAPRFRVRLVVAPAPLKVGAARTRAGEPSAVQPLAGAGILCGALENATFAAMRPEQGSALIVVARDMLHHAYHVRYELLEFAVYVLAARRQGLVPLHAGCLGQDGSGLLLIGPSGSGKSTLVLQGLLAGMDFLAEDSVLVRPEGLLATGIANFVHLRRDSLRFLASADRRSLLRNAELIRRRSGIEKLEIDVRRPPYRLAPAPQRIRGVVFISRRLARNRPLLEPLRPAATLARLNASQRYAAHQPGWRAFTQRLKQLPAYELRRAEHPLAAIEALREVLGR